ncbi:MAG: RNHCP domain-containing protein [Patescibacteria group bacterium]|nr:RNHCP domain-containing protein [Patescibacteria group bacterium]
MVKGFTLDDERLKQGGRKNFLVPGLAEYGCDHCGARNMGGRYHNHCLNCLWSKHVDDQVPGDRASNCQGLMEPVAVAQNKGKWRIRHQCVRCGKVTWVDSAEKDNFDVIVQLSQCGKFDLRAPHTNK